MISSKILIINLSNTVLNISDVEELSQLLNYKILFNTHQHFNPESFKPYQAIIILEK